MPKPVLRIAFGLFALSLIVVAQAQDSQPITQPTVDAAVSTLLAQTQQASGLSATGTVQAALQTAIAGTAQAHPQVMATAPATVVAQTINAAALTVSAQTDLPIHAGAGGRGAYLAPDGQHIANLDGKSLCIYEVDQQQACIDLSGLAVIDPESIRWSPDSRYLVMTEDFFVTYNDPDIWVIDTRESTLSDITDDGEKRVPLTSKNWKDIDIVPAWLPDNRILFLRYNSEQATIMPPDVYTIAADGSDLQQLGTLTSNDPFAIYTLDVQDNHLIYGYAATKDTPDNGVWISDLDGGNARQIVQADRAHLPTMVDLSPDGRYVLVGVPGVSMTYRPDDSLVYVVDVEQGEILPVDPDHYVMSAGWSPVGSALIYATFQPEKPELSGVYVSDVPGTTGLELLKGRYLSTTPKLRQNIAWTQANDLLLTSQPDFSVILLTLSGG